MQATGRPNSSSAMIPRPSPDPPGQHSFFNLYRSLVSLQKRHRASIFPQMPSANHHHLLKQNPSTTSTTFYTLLHIPKEPSRSYNSFPHPIRSVVNESNDAQKAIHHNILPRPLGQQKTFSSKPHLCRGSRIVSSRTQPSKQTSHHSPTCTPRTLFLQKSQHTHKTTQERVALRVICRQRTQLICT